ncbi:MAG TPA: geranylgeranylglyceryl/heptaprenylglyceryl phosphate synthase [Flavobacterium sp.]|nr:geranylgeranylglyceryl/heptaprenylglyceryl phosphate synthase [Flavobacterium sp.]
MNNLYNSIVVSKVKNEKLLAILIDPDKIDFKNLDFQIHKINQSPATHILIGGSIVLNDVLDELILKIREKCNLPIILFPGNPSQISKYADGILFLNLISGRNPDYLIGHQVEAVPILRKTNLEIISTGYILIESGSETAVEKVSKTKPIDSKNIELAKNTALAGEMLGNKLIYLEAGSGAKNPVPIEMIKDISENINIPLIVGGGIKDLNGIQNAYNAGADMVVIGTAFENNLDFFNF